MKVIQVDNFDRETVSDVLIKDNLTEIEANELCEELQCKCPEYGPYWYRVVKDDYKLWDATSLY